MNLTWTRRILDFPVRAAAVADFLCDLRARGTGDLNAVITTLNEGGLCREALRHWTESGWIVVSPNTPLIALYDAAATGAAASNATCWALVSGAGSTSWRPSPRAAPR